MEGRWERQAQLDEAWWDEKMVMEEKEGKRRRTADGLSFESEMISTGDRWSAGMGGGGLGWRTGWSCSIAGAARDRDRGRAFAHQNAAPGLKGLVRRGPALVLAVWHINWPTWSLPHNCPAHRRARLAVTPVAGSWWAHVKSGQSAGGESQSHANPRSIFACLVLQCYYALCIFLLFTTSFASSHHFFFC